MKGVVWKLRLSQLSSENFMTTSPRRDRKVTRMLLHLIFPFYESRDVYLLETIGATLHLILLPRSFELTIDTRTATFRNKHLEMLFKFDLEALCGSQLPMTASYCKPS